MKKLLKIDNTKMNPARAAKFRLELRAERPPRIGSAVKQVPLGGADRRDPGGLFRKSSPDRHDGEKKAVTPS